MQPGRTYSPEILKESPHRSPEGFKLEVPVVGGQIAGGETHVSPFLEVTDVMEESPVVRAKF